MQDTTPTLKTLDEMRTTGYRPTAVACLVNEKRVLLLFKKDYHLWMLPQSGIDTGKEPAEVLFEVIEEEMGKKFLKLCDKDSVYLGDDQVEFLPEKQTNEELTTADGKVFKMIGKHYYFYAVTVSSEEFDLAETQYQESYWFDSKPGLILASKIYQPGKRRITMKAITLLKEKGLIG